MRKIPTMFERDWDNNPSRVLPKVHPSCEWALAGEGWATIKIDGACCMIREGKLYKRREVHKDHEAPVEFEQSSFDKETGKSVGWMPVNESDPQDKWFVEAFNSLSDKEDGTYELCGPKVQKNLENYDTHTLISHKSQELVIKEDVPRDFLGLKTYLIDKNIEGIVFHHPDGRMAKIKKRDFGLRR